MEFECLVCKQEFVRKIFTSTKKHPKYCSRPCSHIGAVTPLVQRECLTCKIEFSFSPSYKKGKFCSAKCIRYTGPIESLSRPSEKKFWDIATQEQKMERLKYHYGRKVIIKEGCWSWSGVTHSTGYGSLVYMRKQLLAHRASWMIHRGEIPSKMFVLHKCDNPICSNPEHLFLGTPKDNTADMFNKKRNGTLSGERHYKSKLTNEKVIEIKRLIDKKVSTGDISSNYSVSRGTIEDIKYGKTWKNV